MMNKASENLYKALYYFSKEDDCYIAVIPELPGCIMDGDTPEEAIKNVKENAIDWLEIREKYNEPIPEPFLYKEPEGESISLDDVASYILEKRGKITTKALQKLSYYSDAWYCGWYKKPMFPEQFQAWVEGPINQELFKKHQGLRIATSSIFSGEQIKKLSDSQKRYIDIILEVYEDYSPDELGDMTHIEDPWLKARKGYSKNQRCSVPIGTEDMIEYYGKQ